MSDDTKNSPVPAESNKPSVDLIAPITSPTGFSPSVEKRVFNFKTAIDRMIEGKKVARKEWKNKDYGFIFSQTDQLNIFRETTDKFHQWILCKGDILAEDYIIVK